MDSTTIERESTTLAGLLSSLASLAAAPGWSLTDEDVTAGVITVAKVRACSDELLTRLTRLARERSLANDAGATSTTAWISNLTHLSRGQAAKFTHYGSHLSDRTEATRRAWAAGAITSEQADLIATTIDTLPHDVSDTERHRAEAFLLEKTQEFSLAELKILATHMLEVIDPAGAAARVEKTLHDQEQHAWAKTTLEMFHLGDGKTRLRGVVPDAQAGILRAALEGLAAPRRSTPSIWNPDGEHSDAASGTLTHPQRLGRAFCELIEHLPTDALPQHGGLAATITVNLDYDQLKHTLGTATLSTGGEISASQARRLACNAGLLPAVLNSKSTLLDLGTRRRLFNDHQRIALNITQKGCCWRGCNRVAAWCEAHHPTWYSHGGTTNLNNAALFCAHHHHLLHNGEWDSRIAPDGTPEIIPPPRIDPHQKPIRHQRFQTQNKTPQLETPRDP